MAYCPNKNLEEWKLLVSSRGEIMAYYLWDKYEGNVPEIESKQSIVKAGLKAIQILNSDKAKQIFDKGNKNNWSLEKILAELAVPREQRELIKGLGKTNLNEIVTDLLANYSYTVEINTARGVSEGAPMIAEDGTYYTIHRDPEDGSSYRDIITKDEYNTLLKTYGSGNTQHYSNLTVPGGINYTENEITTPAITPSIKGHAQFATDQGIGWFRSEEQSPIQSVEDTKKMAFDINEGEFYTKEFTENREQSDETEFEKAKNNGKLVSQSEFGATYKFNNYLYSLENKGTFAEQYRKAKILKEDKNATKTRRILEVQSDWGQKQRKSSEPDINIKYDIQQIINDLQKSGDLKIDCN